jgi:pilus biogenesis lipoprotein CpaD
MMYRSRYTQPARRLFSRRRPRFATTLLALAAVIVTACAEGPPPPPPPNYSDLKVEWTVMTHSIALDDATATPGAPALAGLEQFLDQAAVRLTDQIAYEPPAGVDRVVARAQADALDKHLRRRLPGVRVRLLENSPDASGRIVLGRYVAVQPTCTGWLSPEQQFAAFRNPDNRPDSNFGCATAKILAATVADPGDLVHGRTLTPADGHAQALAIERYRKLESPHPHSNTKLNEVE